MGRDREGRSFGPLEGLTRDLSQVGKSEFPKVRRVLIVLSYFGAAFGGAIVGFIVYLIARLAADVPVGTIGWYFAIGAIVGLLLNKLRRVMQRKMVTGVARFSDEVVDGIQKGLGD